MRLKSGARTCLQLAGIFLFLTGCQTSQDTSLREASTAALQERVRGTCILSQTQIQNASVTAVRGGCACYARRTIAAMTAPELDYFRANGVFDDGARDKGLRSIDACRLKRP